MQKVLTAEQMREVDRLTTERYGIPSILLMENAAHAVARVITEKLGGSVKGRRILIVAGKGNNGGDGAALARILWNQGASCFIDLIGNITETTGDARINYESVLAVSESAEMNCPNENCLFINEISDEKRSSFFYDWRNQHMCVLVDALFGTGLTRPLEGPFAEIVKAIGQAKKQKLFEMVFAVDLPSGLDADNGVIGECAEADVTVTFTAPKVANILPPALGFNGELAIAGIGSPQVLIDEQPSQLYLAEKEDVAKWLRITAFSSKSYKNKRGHALLIAGSDDYTGAAVLCGNAAMRSGVGLVTLCVPDSCKTEIASRVLPEVIVRTIVGASQAIDAADAIAVGCGLSATDSNIEKLIRETVEQRKVPVVIDAGALWFFNPPKCVPATRDIQPPLILTPHEGEFMRLLGTDDKDSNKDRVAAVRAFAVKNNVILVLKGERVLIGAPNGRVIVNPTGNSGLGKAGNGDTLTGILAGFAAQAVKFNIDMFETVVAAVYVAGMAGDIAEQKYGKRVMTASDVRECLTETFERLKLN